MLLLNNLNILFLIVNQFKVISIKFQSVAIVICETIKFYEFLLIYGCSSLVIATLGTDSNNELNPWEKYFFFKFWF